MNFKCIIAVFLIAVLVLCACSCNKKPSMQLQPLSTGVPKTAAIQTPTPTFPLTESISPTHATILGGNATPIPTFNSENSVKGKLSHMYAICYSIIYANKAMSYDTKNSEFVWRTLAHIVSIYGYGNTTLEPTEQQHITVTHDQLQSLSDTCFGTNKVHIDKLPLPTDSTYFQRNDNGYLCKFSAVNLPKLKINTHSMSEEKYTLQIVELNSDEEALNTYTFTLETNADTTVPYPLCVTEFKRVGNLKA